MYICTEEILADFNLAVAKSDRQTAKFSGYTSEFLTLTSNYVCTPQQPISTHNTSMVCLAYMEKYR